MNGGEEGNKWSIGTNGSATFNNITANESGSIGGWEIIAKGTVINKTTKEKAENAQLKAGSLTLNSNGSITGPNWSIDNEGKATFNRLNGVVPQNMNITVKGTGSISGSGMTMHGGGGGGSSSINPGAVTAYGSSGVDTEGSLGNTLFKAYKAKFDDLYAKNATIDNLYVKKGEFNKISARISTFDKLTVMNGHMAWAGHTFELGDSSFWYVQVNGKRYKLQGPNIWSTGG